MVPYVIGDGWRLAHQLGSLYVDVGEITDVRRLPVETQTIAHINIINCAERVCNQQQYSILQELVAQSSLY
jgi:hypothetical protein